MESMGYGTSNITEQMVAPDVGMALDNLVSMAMSKTDALNTLVAATKQISRCIGTLKRKWKIAHHGKSTDQWYNESQTMQTGNSKQLLLGPWLCHECQSH